MPRRHTRHGSVTVAQDATVSAAFGETVSGEGVLVMPEGERMHRVVRVRVENGLVVEAEQKGLGAFPYAEHAFELASAEVLNIVLRRGERQAS